MRRVVLFKPVRMAFPTVPFLDFRRWTIQRPRHGRDARVTNAHPCDTGVWPVRAAVLLVKPLSLVIFIGMTGTVLLPAQTLPTEPTTVPATVSTIVPTTRPVVSSATAPSTAPTTVVSTMPARLEHPIRSEILPTDYAVLTSRSIFMKGRVPTPVTISTDPFAAAATTAPVRSSEESIVFNGVTEVDGSIVAFLEDTTAGKVTIYRVGDSIAHGKITGISLDGLDYQAGDKTLHVLIGQALSGGEAMPVSSRPSTSALSGGPMDILEKLRQKRLQELGQGR